MPYASTTDLPDSVKALPVHGQEIYRAAFNNAYEEYKDKPNQEALAHATAWTAVKKQYKKQGDKWVAKEAKKIMNVPMAVKFVNEEEGIIEALAVPYGGPFEGKDIQGEYFTKDTDLCEAWFPGGRPILYQHGLDPEIKADVVGHDTAIIKKDDGRWIQGQLNKSYKYWEALKALIKAGKLYLSSSSVPHLVTKALDGAITRWPWVETSLTPTPANPLAVISVLKAIEDLEALGMDIPLELVAEVQELYFKIQEKEGAPKSPPKGYPTDPAQYGDPKNFKYPIDKKHINSAVGYFNHDGMQKKGGYSDTEWATIGRRIAAAANKLIGPGHSYSDGKIVTKEAKSMENTANTVVKEAEVMKGDVTAPEQAAPTTENLEEAAEQVEQDPPVDDPGVSQGMAPETHVTPTDQAQTDGTKASVKDVAPPNALSTNDIRSALRTALEQKYSAPWGPGAQNCYIEDVFNDTFIFSTADALYKQGYAMDGEAITLVGDPAQVVRHTSYDPAPITATGKAIEPAQAAKAEEAKAENTDKPTDPPTPAPEATKAAIVYTELQVKAIVEEAVAPLAERLAKFEAQPASDGPVRRVVRTERPTGLKGAVNDHMDSIQGSESAEAIQAILKDPSTPTAVKSYLGERLAGVEMRGILNKGPQPLNK